MAEKGSNSFATLNRRTLLKAGSVATLASALPLPAVSQGTKRELIHGIFGSGSGNLNPMLRTDIAGGIIMRNVFDGLIRPNYAERRVEPWLVEDWTRPNPTTVRVKLREGVKWHKGFGEFTSEDVIYTWQSCIDNSCHLLGSAMFPIASLAADGPHVVEVTLKQPFGAFAGVTLGYGGEIACKAAHQEMGDQYNLTPVGNGPFEVMSNDGNEVLLRAHPDYWRVGEPYLEELVFRAIPDTQVRLQALVRGEVDFISQPDTKDVVVIQDDANLVYSSVPGWGWDYQQFDLSGNDNMPFHDKRVRQAISYAIDREAIVQEIYNGEATVTDNQIPPGFLGHREGMLRYPKNGDLAKARELMSQAGVSGYEVEVICSDKDWLRRQLELVAAMVSQIGITYRIRNLDIGSFNNLWLNENFQQHLEDITIVAPDTDATSWWFFHSEGSVTAGYNNPQMDSLLDQARASDNRDDRVRMYHQITDIALDDQPYVFHLNPNLLRAHKTGLTGFSPAPQQFVEWFNTARWE